MNTYFSAYIAAAITVLILTVCALYSNAKEGAPAREYVETLIGACMLLTFLWTIIEIIRWIFS